MASRVRVLVTVITSVVVPLIGAAAAIKALATPMATQAATVPAASGGSASVTGSGNTTVVGSGNNTVSGGANGLGAGAGNTINLQPGAITNVYSVQKDPKSTPPSEMSRALPGQWAIGFSYPTTLGSNDVAGHTNFLRTGGYNFQGTETAHATAQGKHVDIEWGVTDVGKWVARDGFLTMESSGLRSTLRTLTVDGAPVDVARLRALGMPEPRLEDYVPAGMGTDFKLLSMSASEVHLQATSPTGSKFEAVSRRTSAI